VRRSAAALTDPCVRQLGLSNLAPNITELLRAVLQRQNSFARMSHGLRLAVLTMQRGQMIILVQEEKKRRGKLASNIQYEV
jgi:hypothetical protein